MNRRWIETLLFLCALAGVLAALRLDLADLFAAQGMARLQVGDTTGAERAIQRSVALGGDAAPLTYNLGVALYRAGKFAEARKQFAHALTQARPKLMPNLHYNLGNSAYRQAERHAAADRTRAERLFQEAIGAYENTLTLAPETSEARANLGLTRTRLAMLERADAQNRDKKPHATPSETPASEQAKSTAERARDRQVAKEGSANAAHKAAGADPSAVAGKTRRDLSRHDAERMLNEARGRENLSGMLSGKTRDKAPLQPEKDW